MIRRAQIRRLFSSIGAIGSLAALLAGCSLAGGGSTPTNNSPIKIGISLSLSGDFSADGQAFQQGYQLWADYTNQHGGLLGRQVKLDIVSDASDPTQVSTNYQKLITQDKVDLIFGPYSTLLTKPASVTANRYGYAMVEGAGGGPSVFQQGLTNVFDVSLPVANNLNTFADYLNTLQSPTRPTTIAYATEDDPFTQPQLDEVAPILKADGFTNLKEIVYPAETTDFTPIADQLIAENADVVIAGTQLPDVTKFIQEFRLKNYNPKAFIATAGPDQGSAFIQNIGGANVAEGMLVPNGWWPGLNAPQNSTMVQAYIQKYGGTASDISADVAEAWSVGQVVAQAVTQNQSLDQTKLIATLHSGTFQSVQGDVKFDNSGQNTAAKGYLFQWQSGNFVPVYPASVAGSATVEYPKPVWP